MAGTLRWHSCSTTDFPLKRHKVSKACEACRNKKMRCDGKNPCQRCENNKIECKYNDRPTRSRSYHATVPRSLCLSDPLCTDMEIPLEVKKFAFTNQTYETFRLQHSPPQCGTSLLPLLFGFFHLTSQPAFIWDTFTHYYKQCFCSSENSLMESRSQLVKEAIRLFVTHNLLYTMFIDSQTLSSILLQSDSLLFSSYLMFTHTSEYKTSLFSSRHSTSDRSTIPQHENDQLDDYNLLIMFAILALTFSSLHEHEQNEDLIEHAMMFYQKAHQLFFQLAFPAVPSDPAYPLPDQVNSLSLIKAAILLAHFQCSIISPDQAYTTVRIGLDIAHRSPFMSGEESLIVLKTIDAWHIWLAFYLGMPYTNIASSQTQSLPKLSESKYTKEQQWAFQAVDDYSQFMRPILKKQKTTHSQQTRESLGFLSLAVKPSLSFEFMHHDKNPWSTLSLFQHVLDIHLRASRFNISFEYNSARLPSDNLYIIDEIMKSSQYILDISDKTIGYCIDNHLVFLPYPVIYSVCLVSCVAIYFSQHNQKHYFDTLYTYLSKIAKTTSICKDTFESILNQLNHPELSMTVESAIKKREKKKMNRIKKQTAPPSPSPSSSSDVTAIIVSRASSKPSASTTSCDTGGVMISNATSQPDTPATMSQFLAQPIIPNELLLMDSMRTAGIDHMASHPMSIHSRADIDREQLEKLSHKPSRLQQQYQQYQHEQQMLIQQQQQQQQQQQKNQKQWPQYDLQQSTDTISSNSQHNNHYLFPKYVMPSSINASGPHRTKGDYNATQTLAPQDDMTNNYQYYQNNKRNHNHASNFNLQAYKKFKPSVHISSSSSHLNQKQHSQIQTESSYNHLQDSSNLVNTSPQHDRSRQNSLVDASFIDVNELNSEPQSADDAALMYWMLDGSDNAAAFYQVPTPTGAHTPLSTQDNKPEVGLLSSPVQQDHFGYHNSDHNNNSTPQSNSMTSIQSWQPSFETEDNALNAVTKLPLPQPSKSSAQSTNYWATSASARTWSKFFFASEVQTLHYQTPSLVHCNENSSFPMSLNMTQEEENQNRQQQDSNRSFFYSYGKDIPDKASTTNKSLVVLPSQQIQSLQTSSTTEEVAAAAAIWVAAADRTRPTSNKDVSCTTKRKATRYNSSNSRLKEGN